MLFAQIAAFILVMVVFTAYQAAPPTLAPASTILACGVIWAALWVGGRLATVLFLARLSSPKAPPDPARAAHRLLFYLNAASVLAFFLMVTQADLKAQLFAWFPLFSSSETLAGLAAILVYLSCLGAVWWAGHPVERSVLYNDLGVAQHVLGQVRFVAPVVFPWLLMELVRDLAAWLAPGLAAWFETSLGDLAFLFIFVLILALVFPFAVKTWWGCRPLPPGQLRSDAQEVLDRAGVKVAGILDWPILQGRLLTAGILGAARRARYLLITPGLASALGRGAMMAVVAHEAGHVRHKHIISYLALFLGFFFLAYALVEPLSLGVSAFFWWASQYQWGLSLLGGASSNSGLAGVLMALPLLASLLLYIRFVLGFFMRHFERQADFYALSLMGGSAPLAEALTTIADLSGGSHHVPSWHHFSIAQRVAALRAAEADPALINGERSLIRKGVAVYLAGVLLTVGTGLLVYLTDPAAGMRAQVTERVLSQKLAEGPVSPRLRMYLGIHRFEHGKERQALLDLNLAAQEAPEDPEVLNSLAWVLVACKDKDLRDPRRGLSLAVKAVSILPSAHILDTLAQAYFVNGSYGRAVAAARSALDKAPPARRGYYQGQLEKFQKAARG